MSEIKTIAEQDALLEQLWGEFSDVPMNPDTEKMEEAFLGFPAGTQRETIWHWFDDRYSKGVYHLLYNHGGVNRTGEIAEMRYLRRLHSMCFECETMDCVFNHDGECRYALVYEEAPNITDEKGCESGEIPQ